MRSACTHDTPTLKPVEEHAARDNGIAPLTALLDALSRPIVLPPAVTLKVLEARASRTCRYCSTAQRSGLDCARCGAPDDGARGPLTMAPMCVVLA